MKLEIKQGEKYTRLSIVKELSRAKSGHRAFLCACECGNTKSVLMGDLRSGKTRSCGCLRNEYASKLNLTHGHKTGGKMSDTYLAWRGMRTRCNNKKNEYYHRYGGRGITYDKCWEKF